MVCSIHIVKSGILANGSIQTGQVKRHFSVHAGDPLASLPGWGAILLKYYNLLVEP